MSKKKLLILLAILAVLSMGAASVLTGMAVRQHKTDGQQASYPADAEFLDLRGQDLSVGEYETLCGKLPQCRILWDVPFQGQKISSDAESLQVTSLKEEDAALLGYFPQLRELDASGCRDYEILMQLSEKRPRCRLRYQVEIGNQNLPQDAEELHLASGESSGEELTEKLPYLPKLRRVFLEEPVIPARQLRQLMKDYPKISFEWTKTLFGQLLRSSTSFLDLSGMHFDSLEEVRDQAAYLPGLTQIDMLNCGFSNDAMRAFRDQVREDYKVVFNVKVGTMDLRTDVDTFFPDRDHGKVKNKDICNLRYCEDLICVDVGHLGFYDVEWVEGTPHLKYLIMSDGGVYDLRPLTQLKELEFLELFMTGVEDVSPLAECTSIRDLNLGVTPLGDITPLTKMTWLEKLWVNRTPISMDERKLLTESLPNTHIEFDEYYPTWGGWRDMPRYFDMRDVLHVPYMR